MYKVLKFSNKYKKLYFYKIYTKVIKFMFYLYTFLSNALHISNMKNFL